jgi:glycosyltransferase involved in cell wall biosynthesis
MGTEAGFQPGVLIVASWFPSVDDPGAGRFVADQAEALAAAGVFRPAIITYDPIRLTGGARARSIQAITVTAASRAAIARPESLFLTPAWAVQAGIGVARLSVAEGLTASAGPAHAAIHREAVLRALGDRLAAAGQADELHRAVGLAPPDAKRGVIHAHTGYPDGAAAVALADALDWPLIVTEHASFVERLIGEPILRASYAAMLGRADRLFAVSEMLASELRDAFPEHAAKIDVLPNAVPVDRFGAASQVARRPDELLFVGYRKASKGIATLLRGVAVAHATRPSVTLRLVGNATAEDDGRWQSLAAELGIADAVTFDAAADRDGVAAAMSRASVFVHASPRETFGVVVVEALASGMPVVATESGGVSEILGPDPDPFGAIVPVDDPTAFGAAILRTLERRESFDPAALRSSVQRRFGADFVAERLHVAYREALARRSPPNADADSIPGEPQMGQVRAGDRTSSDERILEPGPAGARGPGDVRPVVVALDRETAVRRLAALPRLLLAQTTLVTGLAQDGAGASPAASTVDGPAAAALTSLERLVEVDVEPRWRPVTRTPAARRTGWVGRLARLASDPVGTLRRRAGRDADATTWLAEATAAARALVADRHGDTVDLVPIDGHDALAVQSLAATPGVRIGGLRRIADRWLGDTRSGADEGT